MKLYLTFICVFLAVGITKGSIQVSYSQYIPPRLYLKEYTLTQSGSASTISSVPYVNTTEYEYSSTYDSENVNFSGNESSTYYGTPYYDMYWDPAVYPPDPYSLDEQITESGVGYFNSYEVITNNVIEVRTDVNFLGSQTIYSTNLTDDPLVLENANFSGSQSIVGGLETVNRIAVTIMKLQTGGKKTSAAHNLFGFNVWTTQVAPQLTPVGPLFWWDPFALYQDYGPTNEATVSQNVSIGNYGKSVGGELYCVLADNVDVVVTPTAPVSDYTFTLGEQKFRAFIQADNAILCPNNVVSNANFCVGQQINLSLVWSPYTPLWLYGGPPAIGQIGPVQWVLDGTFVNTNIPPIYNDGCPDYYAENPFLLTNATTCAWWTSGGFNPATYKAQVGAGITCPNGQYVAITANGLFTMYRPKLVNFDLFAGPNTGSLEHDHEIGGTAFDYLEYGGPQSWADFYYKYYGPSYRVDVDSQFGGNAFTTQLVNGYETNSQHYVSTFGTNELDGIEVYPSPGEIQVYANQWTDNAAGLDDLPYVPCDGNTAQNCNFTDYIRFQPSGGIPVTLGTLNWNVVDSTTYDADADDYIPILSPSDTGGAPYLKQTGTGHTDSGFTDSESFPFWYHTLTTKSH